VEPRNSLIWKFAAWGSELDRSILRRTTLLESLGHLADSSDLTISEGMQLRSSAGSDRDPNERHPEIAGALTIDLEKLEGLRQFFAFPNDALVRIAEERTYVRKGRFALPEKVSRPPHILVNAARNWALFSDEYIVVPARQIGMAGTSAARSLLKALTLYLNSQFVQYHQFFASPQAGVKRGSQHSAYAPRASGSRLSRAM
jgi:hypothetical protein